MLVRRVYLDNAATSFPKPPAVWDAVVRFATQNGSSPGRGQYAESREGARLITQCRERLSVLLHDEDASAARFASRVVFTLNTSDALNLAIKGVVRAKRLREGLGTPIRLITTAMDHNSVLRPYAALAEEGASVVHVEPDPRTGLVSERALEAALRANAQHAVKLGETTLGGVKLDEVKLIEVRAGAPTLVALNWVSNVSGTIQPIEGLVKVAKSFGAPVLVDVAQGLGHLPFDVRRVGCDLVAFPGHKGLLGPQGTGGLWIAPGFEAFVATTREGGTGSIAELDAQPTSMPERYEAGSHNTVGIAGLSEGVQWLLTRGVANVRQHELALITLMVDLLTQAGATFTDQSPPGVGDDAPLGFQHHGAEQQAFAGTSAPLAGVRVLGMRDANARTGTFSLVHPELSAPELAALLEQQSGVLVRAGIHCAPLAHRAFGTLDYASGRGALRMSLGPFVTEDDVRHAVASLCSICEQATTL